MEQRSLAINQEYAIPQLNVNLATNQTVAGLCRIIETKPFNWNTLLGTVRTIRDADRTSMHGLVAELHLQQLLGQTAIPLRIDPIASGTQTDSYSFRKDSKGRLVAYDQQGRTVAEYDALIEADGLPVVIEVKASNRASRGSTSHSLDTALTVGGINRRFAPLKEYYNTNTFGYIVTTTRNAIQPNSLTQQCFQERGGILIPLPASLKDIKGAIKATVFDDDLRTLQKKHNRRA